MRAPMRDSKRETDEGLATGDCRPDRSVTLGLLSIVLLSACADGTEATTSARCDVDGALSTGIHAVQVDGESRTYHVRVPQGFDRTAPPALILAFHGTGGSGTDFVDDQPYNLEGAVGEGALLVYPNALPGNDGRPQWRAPATPLLFDAVLEKLAGCFDPARVYVSGHSSGGGAAHALACERGDRVRAAAPVAGLLIDDDCVGQVAVIQMHHAADDLVPASTGLPAKSYWVARNGCDETAPEAAAAPQCERYPGCDMGFDVQWCAFDDSPAPGGSTHDWPTFAGPAIWTFFQSLPRIEPSAQAPRRAVLLVLAGQALAEFSLQFPEQVQGTPARIATSLYLADTQQPLTGSPQHLLNLDLGVGDWAPGQATAYRVLANLAQVDPGVYTFAVIVYIAGGTYPIPTSGFDYVALASLTIAADADRISVDQPMVLELLQ